MNSRYNRVEKIKFFHSDISEIKLNYSKVKQIINRIIADYHLKTGIINIIFSSDDFLIEMNRKYLNHDYYTDIITFSDNRKSVIGGELYISTDRVDENARIYHADFEHELMRVITHGILHLIGLDDKTEEEKANIRKVEDYYIGMFDDNGRDFSCI